MSNSDDLSSYLEYHFSQSNVLGYVSAVDFMLSRIHFQSPAPKSLAARHLDGSSKLLTH